MEGGVVGALPVSRAAAGGVEGVGEEGRFERGGAEDGARVGEVGGGARGGVGEHVAGGGGALAAQVLVDFRLDQVEG